MKFKQYILESTRKVLKGDDAWDEFILAKRKNGKIRNLKDGSTKVVHISLGKVDYYAWMDDEGDVTKLIINPSKSDLMKLNVGNKI